MRVPDLKSMPKLIPLPPIAIAPTSRIVPDSVKNQREAPMKSNVHCAACARAEQRRAGEIARERPIVPRIARVAAPR